MTKWNVAAVTSRDRCYDLDAALDAKREECEDLIDALERVEKTLGEEKEDGDAFRETAEEKIRKLTGEVRLHIIYTADIL